MNQEKNCHANSTNGRSDAEDAPIVMSAAAKAHHRYGVQSSEPAWFMLFRVVERHIGTIVAFMFFPLSWSLAVLCFASYAIRFVGLDVVYHRYFSHKSYRVGRVTQFTLGLIGAQSGQRGPLWWAAKHRDHHKYVETDRDPHSPVAHSVMHAAFRWFVAAEHVETNLDAIPDFAQYRELRWLNRYYWIPFYGAALVLFLIGHLGWFGAGVSGWSALLWGFEVPATLVLYMSAGINVMNHLPPIPGGYRRYATRDTSTNRLLLGIVTSGAGFHNNHHAHPASAKCGFSWWEFDTSYYAIRTMQILGLAWDIRLRPSETSRIVE